MLVSFVDEGEKISQPLYYTYLLAPPTLNQGQELHQVRVHLHDQDVDNVQDEHDECFIPVEHTIPGEPDKEGD